MHHSLSLLVYHLHIWCSFEIVPQFLDILFLDCFFFSFFLLEFQFGKFFLNYLQVHQCLGSLALADEPMEIALISLTVLFLALVFLFLEFPTLCSHYSSVFACCLHFLLYTLAE